MRYSILTITLLALVFSSCDEFRTVVELDVPDIEDQLVVNSFYTPDSLWSVLLTQHRYVLDDDPIDFIDGATVSLLSEGSVIAETTSGDSGYYQLPIIPSVNTDYVLRISHPNYPTAEVETRLETPVTLTDLTIEQPSDLSFEGLIPGSLSLTDPADQENFYQLILYSFIEAPVGLFPNGDTLWEEYSYPIFFQIGATSAGDIIEINPDVFWFMPGQVFSDELFNGQSVTLDFEIFNDAAFLPEGSRWEIFAEFQSLSPEFHDYAFSYGVQRNAQGNPFSQPAQVFTNVQNGLGIVAGYGRTATTYTIID